jgi:hypothetical protein
MSAARLAQLQSRRAYLVALAAQQRADMARSFEAWKGPAALVDRGVAAWRFLKARPLLLAAGATLVVIVRRRRAMTWLSGLAALWRLYRMLTDRPPLPLPRPRQAPVRKG